VHEKVRKRDEICEQNAVLDYHVHHFVVVALGVENHFRFFFISSRRFEMR
jgi:hypothetical protein